MQSRTLQADYTIAKTRIMSKMRERKIKLHNILCVRILTHTKYGVIL